MKDAKRNILIQTEVTTEKFCLIETYRQVPIYEKITPHGYRCSQNYAFVIEGKTFVSYSFTNKNIEDIYDCIDNYYKTGKLKEKAFNKGNYYCLHTNGDLLV